MKRALTSILLLAMSVAACSDGSKSSADHRKNLARGETALVAAQLVPVRGYSYINASQHEISASLARLTRAQRALGVDKFFAGVSLHDVVAHSTRRSGTKAVGKLHLYEFVQAPRPGSETQYASLSVSGMLIDQLDVSGTPVSVFEELSSRGSRYHYTWVRHGVQGALDGADRATMERWLRAYLAKPVLVQSETAKLSAWLVGLPGYAYGNFTSSRVTDTWVKRPLGDVPFSLHQVADVDGVVGNLVLARVPSTYSTEQLMRALKRHGPSVRTTNSTMQVGGTRVNQLASSEGDAFVWAQDGIAGVFVTTHPDRATPFLAALLGAAR